MAELIRIDKNGTKYYEGFQPCDRCNGEGIYFIGVLNGKPLPSPVDGGICFKCGGAKVIRAKWKEYTPEYEAKLEEQRRKRAEKKAKEQEAELAEIERQRKEQEERERLEALQEAIKERKEKTKSHYVGTVGERVYIEAVYIKTAWFESPSFRGYGTDTTYIHTFAIGDDKLIWKTTSSLGRWVGEEWKPYEEGERVRMKATIKEHSEYDGEKQTVLTRCKMS